MGDAAVVTENPSKFQNAIDKIFTNLYVKPLGTFIYLICLTIVIIIISSLAFVIHPIEIDFSLSSLIVPTHHASIKLQSYLAAKHAMANGMEEGSFIRTESNESNFRMLKKRSYSPNPFRSPPGLTFQTPYSQTALYPFWTLDIVFVATGNNSNMLTEDRVQYVKYVEQEITQHKDYSRYVCVFVFFVFRCGSRRLSGCLILVQNLSLTSCYFISFRHEDSLDVT